MRNASRETSTRTFLTVVHRSTGVGRGQGPSRMTRSIEVAELLSNLKQGMTDKELMEKYEISADGLRSLFSSLLIAMSRGSSYVAVESDLSRTRS